MGGARGEAFIIGLWPKGGLDPGESHPEEATNFSAW